MAEQLLDLHLNKEEGGKIFDLQVNKEEEGKLYYTSPADGITIGIPPNAVLFAVPLLMLLVYVLRSRLLSKFKSNYSAPLYEYSSAYEPASYGPPIHEEYGPPGRGCISLSCRETIYQSISCLQQVTKVHS